MESGITFFGSNNLDSISSITLFILPWLLFQALVTLGVLYLIPINLDKELSWIYVISNLVIIYFSGLYYATKLFDSINIIICLINSFVLAGLAWIYIAFGSMNEKLLEVFSESLANHSSSNISLVGKGQVSEALYFSKLTYFGGFLLQGFTLAIVFFIKFKPKFSAIVFNRALIKKVLIYSSVAFISNIIFFLVTRIDYFFVEKYCSEIALSNYVQVSKMGQLLILLPTIIASVVFPYSSSGALDNEYLIKIQSLCRIIGLLFVPAAGLIIFTGYWVFPWLFGTGFKSMYPAMLLYLPGFYFLSIVTLLAAYIAGKAMVSKNLLASGIALVVVITGDVFLIPAGGIKAAAAVSSLGYFLCLLYLLWVFKQSFDCKAKDFFAFRSKDLQLLFKRTF